MPKGYEYSRFFFDRFYRPENVVLVIAGDFDFDQAEGLIHQYYDGWEPGYLPPDIRYEGERNAPVNITIEYPGATLPIISVNYLGPAWSATDTLAVATTVLGAVAFGPNSDLYKRLVIQEGRVQYLSGGFGLSRDPDLLTIQTMANNPDDVDSLRAEIKGTVDRFRTDLVDAGLLSDTKSNLKYGFLMGLETGQDVAFSLIPYIINTGGIEAVNEYFATLDADHGRRRAGRRLRPSSVRTDGPPPS